MLTMTQMLIASGICLLMLLVFVRIVPKQVTVVDGDTIAVRNSRWRLAGYDTPEFNQPGGRQASAYLRKLLAQERMIAILIGTDPYGRRIAHILTRKGPLSWRMILAGWGHPESLIGYLLCLVPRIFKRGIWDGKSVVHTPRLWRQMYGRQGRAHHPATQYHHRRKKDLRFQYDNRKGLKLPGGFIIP